MTASLAAPPTHAPPARPVRGSIVARLVAALAVLALLLAALGGLTVRSASRALDEVRHAERSLVQIEKALAMEAAFNRYLLDETVARLTGEGVAVDTARRLRGALLAYRAGIAHGIETARDEATRDAERAEMRRAAMLSTIFEVVQTEALRARAEGTGSPGEAARRFVEGAIGERDAVFRTLVGRVLEDERAEAVAAFSGLDRLAGRAAAAWVALAALLLGAAGVFAWLFYRGVTRPIAAFAEAAAPGPVPARVPESLPGEFAALARRFNAMAGRIASERTRLEGVVAERTAALEAANAELREIDAARRRFFANVGHELRTPLTVLLGEAQIALRGADPEGARAREALGRIVVSGRYLRRRLDDVLRLARSEDGRLALEMGEADLAAAVGAAVEATRGYAEAHEIALVAPPPPAACWRLHADGEALTQAALALIDNAVKFTPPDGTVTVTLFADDATLGFRVADTGPGFEGEPARLFDRYAQESAGRGAGGSGLGLAIVRWIAEGHGGRVEAGGRPGGGAVLPVTQPRRTAETRRGTRGPSETRAETHDPDEARAGTHDPDEARAGAHDPGEAHDSGGRP
ncbi:MAG: sensor histidine kinase [Paracoccaceae bacterium]